MPMGKSFRRFFNLVRTHRNWLAYEFAKVRGYPEGQFCFRTRSGLEIVVPAEIVFTYKECFFDQVYTSGFNRTGLEGGDGIVLDVGANAGFFALFAISEYPGTSVISFEPMPGNFSILQGYWRKFSGVAKWEVVNAAVAGHDGDIEIFTSGEADDYTTSASIDARSGQAVPISCRGVSLKTVLDERGIARVDLLKLDCEGAEYEIIYQTDDDTLSRISRIAIETHGSSTAGHSQAELAGYLTGKGYRVKAASDFLWAQRGTENVPA